MNMNIFDVKEKVILYTGGYGYLARDSVRYLAQENAKVYVLARDIKKFNSIFQEANVFFQEFDLSSTVSIKKAFKEIFDKEGKLDVLINNAFYSRGQSPENMTDEDFAFGVEGTLNSTFICIREIIPYFLKQKSGKIINISSMYGLVAPDFSVYETAPNSLNPPHYGAAKAGIIQLTKYYASYLGRNNIQVNTITPGPFPSNEVQLNNEEFIAKLADHTMLNRIGVPEDLIGAVVLLSSKGSNYITGQNFVIDGGWTSR